MFLQWPGYESFGTYIRVQNKGGGYITRGELAKAVCQRIDAFMRKAVRPPSCACRAPRPDVLHRFAFQKRKRLPSAEDEAYTIAHGKSRHGISIDKLWLVRVVPKAASMWMAELEIQT